MANNLELAIRLRAEVDRAIRDFRRAERGIRGQGEAAKRAGRDTDQLSRSFTFLTRAVAAYLSLNFAKRLLTEADAYNVLQQRLRTATKETGDYLQVSRELFAISQQNGTQLETTVSIYQGLARSARELGASSQDILRLTRAVQQLGVISGASQANLSAGLLQFSQAMAAGVVRAEELNSLLENIPEVATRIARGMGRSVGELRQAVLEGRVLSRDVFRTLLAQAEDIDREFDGMALSLGRATTALTNSLQRLAGALASYDDTLLSIAGGVQSLSGSLDELSAAIDGTGAVSEITATKLNVLSRQLLEARQAVIRLERSDLSDPLRLKALEEGRRTIEALRKEIAALTDQTRGAGDETVRIDEKTRRALQATIDALREQADTFGLNAEQIARYRLALLGADEAQLKLADDLIETIEADRAFEAQVRASEQAVKDENAAYQAWLDTLGAEGQAVYEATRTDMERLGAELARLDGLLAQGVIDWDTYSRAVFDAQSAIEQLAEDSEPAFERMTEFGIQAARNIQSAFGDFFFAAMRNDFDGLLESWERTLQRMVAELMASQLTQFLLGSFGTTGQLGGLVGNLFVATARGGGIAGALAPSRRVPGLLFAGAPRYQTGGIAGLAPDEVPAILHRGEEVLTRRDPRHRANGGALVNVTIQTPDVGGFQRARDQVAAELGEAVARAMRRNR